MRIVYHLSGGQSFVQGNVSPKDATSIREQWRDGWIRATAPISGVVILGTALIRSDAVIALEVLPEAKS